jgi:hypothetical protein
MFVEHKELVEFFKLRVCGVCLSLNQISAARVWYLKYKVPLLPSNESQSCKNCTSSLDHRRISNRAIPGIWVLHSTHASGMGPSFLGQP